MIRSLNHWKAVEQCLAVVLFGFQFYPFCNFGKFINCGLVAVRSEYVNPLRPNSDLSQTSHCNIQGLSVSEVMRIENMITQVQFD